MKALSIRQPWVWAILNAGKDIENRDWPTRFRGPVIIHAAKGCTYDEYDSCRDFRHAMHKKLTPTADYMRMPDLKELDRGGIVGIAEIVDCVDKSESPWFFGRFGFVLRNVKPLPFRPFKGALGFFDVPDELGAP